MNSIQTYSAHIVIAVLFAGLVFSIVPAVATAADWDYGMNEVAGWDSAYGYDSGWDSGYGYDAGWDSGYGYDAGWDSGYGYDAGWDSGYGYDAGWDVAAPESWSVAAPESWSVAAPESWSVAAPESWSVAAPEYYNEYLDEYYYSTDSYSVAQHYSQPMTIAPPRYTPPIYQNPPVYTPPRPQPPVVIPQQPNVSNTNINTNTCVNNSCNTNIDNSIHGSFNTNVATVVPVTPQPVIQYTYPVQQQGMYCIISASQTSIAAGQTTYLAWSSSYNVTSATLSEFGSVAPSGTRAVYPGSTRTYVLTVYGPAGTNTCSVTVNVNNPAPYVSLSQIPYTGLDLGLFGSALYWMGLLSFAVAGGYLVVYFRGGALNVAMETVRSLRSNVHASHAPEPVSETLVAAPAAPAPEETSYNALESLPVMASRSTRDSMQVTRDENGTPRIVIARA